MGGTRVAFFIAWSVGLLCAQALAYISNRCLSEYTWTVDGKEFGYKALKQDICSSSTLCASPYPKPGKDMRPPPVEGPDEGAVFVNFYGMQYSATINSTCLHVEYTLNRWAPDKIKGIQFLLHGLGYNSHNTDCCQILNYTTPLSYDAVYPDLSPKIFSFDCFCDLWPSENYKLTIRTLPVDFNNQTLLDDSSVQIDIFVPDCSGRSWDQHCKQSKEELWRPQLVDTRQNIPDYLTMSVTFNIAPLNYRFTEYVVSIYENGSSGRPLNTKQVFLSSGQFFEVVVNGLRVNATSVIFDVTTHVGKVIYASIFARCDFAEQECSTSTIIADEEMATIIDNPCNSNPCGALGSCEPDRENYNCSCNASAIFDGTTCIDNPCNSNPCTDLGACHLDGAKYYCNCTTNESIDTGTTCVANPCYSKPCDVYSTCEINDDYSHDCVCTDGITCIVDKCATASLPESECITKATCDDALSDLGASRKYYDCDCHPSEYQQVNVSQTCVDNTCDGNPCNDHGVCNYSVTPQGSIKYNCSCLYGYTMNMEGKCTKSDDLTLLVICVAVALVTLAILVGCSYLFKKHWKRVSNKLCLQQPKWDGTNVTKYFL